MADLGSFTPRELFRISSDIRLSRAEHWHTNLGTFRTEPSRGHRFAALATDPLGRLAVWGIDFDGTVEEKSNSLSPSCNTGLTGYPSLRYEVALGPSLSLDVESKPSMWVLFWRPDQALGVWHWDVYRDEHVKQSSASGAPAFQWEPSFGPTWQPDEENSVCFFAAGSKGDGANEREVLVLRGFWRNSGPPNYRGFQLHCYNPQSNSWRDLGGPPPPSWGINREQEPAQAVPANGAIQMIWQTNSQAGIVSPGSQRPRIEEVGARTSPIDGFGTAIQQINDDPAINGALNIGRPIGAYDVPDATPPTLKVVTVELEAQVIHVYRTTPHISTSIPQWTEQTVDQPDVGETRFAHLALTGDRAGMVGEESGRQWLYCDGFDGDTFNIWRASFDVIQERWGAWEFVCDTRDAVQLGGENLIYEQFSVIAGDDHVLLLIEYVDVNEDNGPDNARRVFGLFDPAEGGASTGGFSGPGRPNIVRGVGSSGSVSYVA